MSYTHIWVRIFIIIGIVALGGCCILVGTSFMIRLDFAHFVRLLLLHIFLFCQFAALCFSCHISVNFSVTKLLSHHKTVDFLYRMDFLFVCCFCVCCFCVFVAFVCFLCLCVCCFCLFVAIFLSDYWSQNGCLITNCNFSRQDGLIFLSVFVVFVSLFVAFACLMILFVIFLCFLFLYFFKTVTFLDRVA